MCHAAFFLKSSRHTPCTTNSQLPTTNCQSPTAMTLTNEQPFIYAWHYKNDTVCKLGVSTTRKFHTLIKAAKSVTWQDIELLGIELYDTHAAAQAAYKELLKTFDRVHSRRAWVHLNEAVRAWLGNGCLPNPPSLDAFREVFQNDPQHRQKEREYQRRHAEKRKASKPRNTKSGKKPTEYKKAYNREYARKRRQNDPEYRQRQNAAHKRWQEQNPDYQRNRYANDPEYQEKRKAARREKYANDPEYRQRQYERWIKWKENNPDHKQRRAAYMREWRKKNPDYDKNRYREKANGKTMNEG